MLEDLKPANTEIVIWKEKTNKDLKDDMITVFKYLEVTEEEKLHLFRNEIDFHMK